MNIAPMGIKFISQLANNSDSIVPMAVKDTISNGAIVLTYRKEGGKDDARERAIEEFGTGAVWLFAIPAIKKFIDKVIYPVFKLNPEVDCKNLNDEFIEKAKNAKNISQDEKNFFENLTNQDILKHKGAFLAKFTTATALSAFALVKIIKWKQRTTQKRIENDFIKNYSSEILLNKELEKEKKYQNFTSKTKNKKQNKNLSFKGKIGDLFLYNPIANTFILDGFITRTRFKEGRKGEKKEIGLKELFQIIFIYGLAKPIQFVLEKTSSLLKLPIELDPILLFDKNLNKNLDNSKETINNLLESSKNLKDNEKFNFLKEAIYNLDIEKDKSLLELLEQNQVINLVRKNKQIEGISYFNYINGKDINKTFNAIQKLSNHINNLKGIKIAKVTAVILNVLIAAWAMGRLQPKVNIAMRKFLNNGDNRNPAIVAQEEEFKEKFKKGEISAA